MKPDKNVKYVKTKIGDSVFLSTEEPRVNGDLPNFVQWESVVFESNKDGTYTEHPAGYRLYAAVTERVSVDQSQLLEFK
jgi:hypothetical protein